MRSNKKNTKSNLRSKVVREQPKKDSDAKRVNFDNVRVNPKERAKIQEYFDRHDSNDVRWYTKNKARLDAAARFNFTNVAGLNKPGIDHGTVPGIMRIAYNPNFVANEAVINQAFISEYSDIVHANSRNQSYDAPDLAMIIYAGMEIFAAISMGIRAYGLMKQYTEANMYMPNALISACGFDPKDLRSNYSHMYSDILNLIAQSRQIWIPNNLPVIERRIWMNTHVYLDGESALAQMYVYVPASVYKYTGYGSATGGKLVRMDQWKLTTRPLDPYAANMNYMKWNDYIAMVQEMLDALLPDQDRGIIYGDILKAYGTEGIFALKEIAIDYITNPTYNPEVLWQIENCVTCATTPVELVQDNGRLLQHWATNYAEDTADQGPQDARGMTPSAIPINFHQKMEPTSEQLAVATRMIAMGFNRQDRYNWNETTKQYEKDASLHTAVPTDSGTELAFCFTMYKVDSANPATLTTNTLTTGAMSAINAANARDYMAFDWAPRITGYRKVKVSGISAITQGDLACEVVSALCDFDNWITMDQVTFARLNTVIICSLYNVPFLNV